LASANIHHGPRLLMILVTFNLRRENLSLEYADSLALTTLTLTGESPGFLINLDEVPKPNEPHRSACHDVLSIRTDTIERGSYSSSLASLLDAILTSHKSQRWKQAAIHDV